MNKVKTIKIKNEDGSISEESYTISVDAKDVDKNPKVFKPTGGIMEFVQINEDIDTEFVDYEVYDLSDDYAILCIPYQSRKMYIQ